MRYELFKVKIGDKTYYGTYRLEAGVAVHVTSVFGSRSAPRSRNGRGRGPKTSKEIVAENRRTEPLAPPTSMSFPQPPTK